MHIAHKPSSLRLYLFFIVLSMLASALVVMHGTAQAKGLCAANASSLHAISDPRERGRDDTIKAKTLAAAARDAVYGTGRPLQIAPLTLPITAAC